MQPLLTWILAAMLKLAPGRDHAELGQAIASVVETERPLFRDDDTKRKTASVLVAIAYRESTFRNDAVGDQGHSRCAMQIYDGAPSLLTDALGCVRVALNMLRVSARTCSLHPIAWYAEGPKGCTSARAQRISKDRMDVAAWLVRSVEWAPR